MTMAVATSVRTVARGRGRVLLVDDDHDAVALLAELLERRGFVVESAHGATDAAIEAARGRGPDVVLTDLRMGATSGLDLVRMLRKQQPGLPVVVITAFGSIRTAIEAIQQGAYDFLTKPYDPDLVALTLDRAVEHARTLRELDRLHGSGPSSTDGIIGQSSAMRRVIATAERIAKTDVTTLIVGESGTGKELIARLLHRHSERAAHPFVAINCTALPEHLLESELFGHTRGAFTDAHTARRGLFVKASGGTLFLDELGDMPLTMQSKLLRVLQEGRIRPVGGDEEHPIDVRVVAATHRDLEAEVRAGRFREDLFFRIHVVELSLPPLRARGDDVLLLAQEFLVRAAARTGRKAPTLTPAVSRRLLAYAWPGNVRELENVMEAALALTEGSALDETALPDRVQAPREAITSSEAASHAPTLLTMDALEQQHILLAMRLYRGQRKLVADALGIDRSTLYRRLLRYGIETREQDDEVDETR
jgi:DNA-binding NtrC family response regulator